MPSNFFLHETSIVDKHATIGAHSRIWHYSHVSDHAVVGKNCVLGQNVFIGQNVIVGDFVKIQNNVSVYEGVQLDEGVFCGPSVVFTNINNPRAMIERKDQFRKTLVNKGASIGANSTIICGVTIGQYAFIGAGCVVTKDVRAHALLVGNPGNQIGWVCECGGSLTDNHVCSLCEREYVLKDGEIKSC
ncbi:MAG: UDP-2-acetamido-3-amino-2,3-dideoxy-glucuronate N-acetyltransferase [Planctomycetota bacterium]|jgi:UDP-2-acetamido-3-amino-2,3-dideoxy-glucuronate N-acetyltransferase